MHARGALGGGRVGGWASVSRHDAQCRTRLWLIDVLSRIAGQEKIAERHWAKGSGPCKRHWAKGSGPCKREYSRKATADCVPSHMYALQRNATEHNPKHNALAIGCTRDRVAGAVDGAVKHIPVYRHVYRHVHGHVYRHIWSGDTQGPVASTRGTMTMTSMSDLTTHAMGLKHVCRYVCMHVCKL